MNNVAIRDTINIEPKDLSGNLNDILYEKLCQKYLNKCNNENGYILAIQKHIKVLSNMIIRTNIELVIEFNALTYKPVVSTIVDGIITNICSDGLTANVYEKMDVHIPIETMTNYDFKTTFFVSKQNKKQTIVKGTKVKIRIESVKYESHIYGCIGEIV